jgi:Zn-dependent protease with chaperone function
VDQINSRECSRRGAGRLNADTQTWVQTVTTPAGAARQLARSLCLLAATLLLSQATVAPALAMSTSQEVAQGKVESAQIDAQSIRITDPFLTSWVNQVGSQLAQHRERRDINYTFTILATPDINAFALKGGFIHVDMGLLNFVTSDDELAATMGHEMGHVELRHVVRSSNTGTIVGILTAIVSMIAPAVGVLGGLGSELATQKFSRAEELQADHYGMRLAAQSGYDPQAAVDVMARLGAMDPGPESRADKAFIDHPVPADRISHLLGYPELDAPSPSSIVENALHDQKEGRYSYAQARLKGVKDSADQALVSSHQTELDYALRESGALAAPDSRLTAAMILPNDPKREQAYMALKAAQTNAQSVFAQAKTDDRIASGNLDNVEQQLNNLNDSTQGQQQQAPPSGGAGAKNPMATAMDHLSADISGTMDALSDVVQTAPGLISPNQDTLRDMIEPLEDDAPLTPKYAALLPFYPDMTAGIDKANNQLLDSIAQTKAAVALSLTATQILSATMSQTPPPQASPTHGQKQTIVMPNFAPVLGAWDAALAKAQQASAEMYAAQALDLSAEITLLDVESSPERYADFAKALEVRFPGEHAPSYDQAIRLGIAPGELTCAAWYAFDTREPLDGVLQNLKAENMSCESAAQQRHLLSESMEIALGLIYEDYTDTPHPNK